MTCPVYEPKTPRRRKRSSLKRQRIAILATLLLVAILATTFGVVYYFTSRYLVTLNGDPLTDADGTRYYVTQQEGVWVLVNEHDVLCPTTTDSNSYSTVYRTADGALVAVDPTTGVATVVAVVATNGTEALEFSSYSGAFDILLYPMLEREQIKFIRVVNEKDSFAFLQTQGCPDTKCKANDPELKTAPYDEFPKNEEGKPICPKCGKLTERAGFDVEGYKGLNYDANMFATLVNCTGYTSTYMRLDPEKVAQYGYGEYGLPDNPDDAKKYFIIEDTAGNNHKVIIGDEVPSGSGYYARYVGRDDVYILKEREETQYSYTFSTALFSDLEAYVTPLVIDPMSSTDYFDVTDFKLSTVQNIKDKIESGEDFKVNDLLDNIITFSYIPIEIRQGTFTSTSPYQGGGKFEGFTINDFMVDDCLQNLQYMEPLRTVKLFTDEEADDALFEFASDEKYGGIAYLLQYRHNLKRDAKKDYEATEWADQRVWVSHLSENNTYFLYNEAFNMIVEVERTHLEFLQWDAFTWVDGDVFSGGVAYMQKLEILCPGGVAGKTSLVFTLDNSASILNWESGSTNSSIPSDKMKVWANGEAVDLMQFKLFYQTLLYSSLSGSASCSEELQELFRNAAKNEAGGYALEGAEPILALKLTYNTEPDGSGETVVRTYAFYKYGGGRQCFMAFNGNGSFYMLQNRVNKIISDIAKVFDPSTPITPTSKT